MTVNYIYNAKGKPEYAVVPYTLWESVKDIITKETKIKVGNISKKFKPSEFKGVLSHLGLDLEEEIKNMRSEWTRNIS